MKKVICINDDWANVFGISVPACAPKAGNDYTVTKTRKCRCGCDLDVYEIEECGGSRYGWDTEYFALASSIDETEMVREYNKEKV